MNLFAQLLGFVGMGLNLTSFQLKEQKKLIRLQFYSSIVFAAHYLLLGAITGCVLNIVGIARAFVYSNKEKDWARKPFWLYLFVAAYIGVYILTFTVFGKEPTTRNLLLELLPVLGMTAVTVGFKLEKASHVRLLALSNVPTWMVYNIFNGSIGGTLTEVCCLISVLVGMLRLDVKKRGKKE